MAEGALDRFFVSTRRDVRQLWTPLVGDVFAERQAGNVQRVITGYGFSGLCYIGGTATPFIWRDQIWMWAVIGGIFVVGAVLCVYWGWLPTLRTSKEVGAFVRAGGLKVKRDPGMQTVFVYRRWLKKNNLVDEDVRRVLESGAVSQ